MTIPFNIRKVIECNAERFLRDNSREFRWCEENATFSHQRACEFILYVPEESEDREEQLRQMDEAGLSSSFVDLVRGAHDLGADLLLLWAD